MTLKITNETNETPEPTLDDWVTSIWKAMPRKVGYKLGKAAIRKEILAGLMPPEDMLAHIKVYAKSVNGQEARYIPHPSTYFNQQRYMDDIEDASGKIVPVLSDLERERKHVEAVIHTMSIMHEHEKDKIKSIYPTLDALVAAFPRGLGDLRERIRKAIA